MYIVVSKWAIKPGKEDAFKAASEKMRDFMRSQPASQMMEGFQCADGSAMAIHGYTDEASYKKLMEAGGAFERAAAEHGIEDCAEWQWSERGESLDRETASA